MMYTYKCKKCNREIGLDKTGRFLECKGCGDRITDSLMVDIAEFDESMTCPSCAGQMQKNSTGEVYLCEFCGNTFIKDSFFDVYEKKYDRIIPFADQSREYVLENFYRNSASQFAPSDFKSVAKIKDIKNSYLVYYRFSAEYSVSYSLEVGTTMTRQVWDSTQKKYKDESYTEWHPQSGSFTKTFTVYSKGFEPDKFELEGYKTANGKTIQKEMRIFSDNLINYVPYDREIGYNPMLVTENDVIEGVKWDDAYKDEALDKFDERIRLEISSLYSHTRNIRFTSSQHDFSKESILVPASFVIYDYKGLTDHLLAVEGANGLYFRGILPNSYKRSMIKIIKRGVPIAMLLLSIYMCFSYICLSFAGKPAFVCLSVVFSFIVWKWASLVRGTGGNKESAAAINNKKYAKKYGFWSVVLSIALIITATAGRSETVRIADGIEEKFPIGVYESKDEDTITLIEAGSGKLKFKFSDRSSVITADVKDTWEYYYFGCNKGKRTYGKIRVYGNDTINITETVIISQTKIIDSRSYKYNKALSGK